MIMTQLATRYDPQASEEKWYSYWEDRGLFQPVDSHKEPYTIVIPPPNVTGILHMGHALNNTIQDILIRWQRAKGRPVLWVPGTDHAGIATQNVVEKKLWREKKQRRQDLGRKAFVEEVWKWKEEYGSTIIRQLRKLGSSCDWSRLRFTMDEGLSKAVQEVFVRLYEKGLVYRGHYIVNWCPRCHTALADEEAPHKDQKSHLWYIRYPYDGGHIVVATTRPETMLGDVAVAVHPEDSRFKKLIGKKVTLPLINKEIPVLADEMVDREFGTGAVKITPAHDPNDFEAGKRHGIDPVCILHPDGRIDLPGSEFDGLDRFKARELVVQRLEEQGLLDKTEDYDHAVGHCYRCDTVVEPYLSPQWFVKMKPLAVPALQACKDERLRFYPARWTRVYTDWMENIRDWCISRQIWWGHRIPVWYPVNADGTLDEENLVVSPVQPETDKQGRTYQQDEDVLDTWFSSWLWPFSTLGWPEKTGDLEKFYPTNCLVTAPEIIFFWVARMVMSGCEFMGDIPFSDVYLHGTIRDTTGKKMSKSLGNIIDPLDVIEHVGADALRFSLVSMQAQGQDLFLSEDSFLIGRNFANKIWNASRFVLMNLPEQGADPGAPGRENLADRWILSRLQSLGEKLEDNMGRYRFNDTAGALYEFFWGDFCDWYLEWIKPVLTDADADSKKRRDHLNTAVHVLRSFAILLQPVMPFLAEEIWHQLHERLGCSPEFESVMEARWPETDPQLRDTGVESEVASVQAVIAQIRNLRAEFKVPPKTEVETLLRSRCQDARSTLESHMDIICRLAKVGTWSWLGEDENLPHGYVYGALDGGQIELLATWTGLDIDSERKRLQQRVDTLRNELQSYEVKLQNDDFVQKAPPEVVAVQQRNRDAKAEELQKAEERILSFQ
ncbi:MAG: valine--tRNA ligase [Candidatus Omnitrophica bacterium]|nr:valine--tRNA ligase [Candidatus Omnitrophota bacterium]